MNVQTYGSGEQVYLCLHGWSGNHRTFEPLAQLLPAGVALCCPDIPACSTLAEVTAALVELAATLPGPLQIVGNCSGALHALLIAEAIPVSRIVMVDAFAYWPAYFRVFLAPGWGQYAYRTTFANPVGRWLSNLSLANRRASSTDLTAGFARVDHNATWRALRQLAGIGSPERFRPLRCAVDLVRGEKSFAAIRRSSAIWQGIFPQAREHVLTGAGHLPLLEATYLISRIIFQETICFAPLTNSAP